MNLEPTKEEYDKLKRACEGPASDVIYSSSHTDRTPAALPHADSIGGASRCANASCHYPIGDR